MKDFLLFIGAFVVSLFLIPIGIIYNIGKSIYNFFKYWYFIIYQSYKAIKHLTKKTDKSIMFNLAYCQDLMWNAFAGEFIEDLITDEEITYFGKGDVTISASVGEIENRNRTAKRGKWFSKFLDTVFKENKHCLNAWFKFIDK